MRAAIHGDNPVLIAPSSGGGTDVQKNDLLGGQNNLVRRTHARNAGGHASVGRVGLISILIQLLNLFPEFWLVERPIRIGPSDQSIVALVVHQASVPRRQIRDQRIAGLEMRTVHGRSVPNAVEIGALLSGGKRNYEKASGTGVPACVSRHFNGVP